MIMSRPSGVGSMVRHSGSTSRLTVLNFAVFHVLAHKSLTPPGNQEADALAGV